MGQLAFLVAVVVALCQFNNAWAQVPSSSPTPSASREDRSHQRQAERATALNARIASDLPIWKRVTLGTLNSVNDIRDALEAAHVHIGDAANEVLGRPAFTFSQTKIESDLVVVAVTDLGFGEAGAPLGDVYTRAEQLGLALCPAEVGPYLRLQYLQQPVGEILQIAMNPVTTYGGAPVDLAVADGGEGLLLVGGEARSDRVINGNVHFVFVRPRRSIVSAGPELR
jgi:hypothetical protein